MNWLALFVICLNILAIQARRYGYHNDRNLIDIIRRRQFDTGRYGAPVLGSPRHPQHLPPAEPVYPGHSLIRPAKGHLKSSFKYPLRDVKNTLVYGNPSTLGITYANENQRLRYSDFRRGRSTDKLSVELAQILQNNKAYKPRLEAMRKQFDTGRYGAPVLGSPRHPQHLPPAEPVYPGHSLIRPAKGHLKSSFKYPLRDVKNTLVYGNPSTLGITYGKENQRLRYSDFRRRKPTNELLEELVQLLQNHKRKRNKPTLEDIISLSSEDNNAREILDIIDSGENNYDRYDLRRKHDKTKYRQRSNEGGDTGSDDTGSTESDEKNPGNPFTIHTNKYKQNFMWNHVMDGDHMNLNPYGPEFKNYGPNGFDLFLGRKWWYFNQDDYKPMS